MRHLDLSFEGRQLAERNQLDNGKLPHGGHKGSRKHPLCHLSYDKGREFSQRIREEIDTLVEQEEIQAKGTSPSWTLLLHREPSYTDESPLIHNSYLSGSKLEQTGSSVNLLNRKSLLPRKFNTRPTKKQGMQYYRPNRTHQYLSATELKDSAEGDAIVKYGRPTRTTLLRARQRCNSAPSTSYAIRREYVQKLDDMKGTGPVYPPSEYLQLQEVRQGESLHSFLTGARYNRAHCLDAKSVENSGVYMPRQNPALGAFFTGPKGQEYLSEFTAAFPDSPTPRSPQSGRRRPVTAPSQGRRLQGHRLTPRSAWAEHAGEVNVAKTLRLNVVGSRLPLQGQLKDLNIRLPIVSGRPQSARRPKSAIEETYHANQPPPTPSSVIKDSPKGRPGELPTDELGADDRTVVEINAVLQGREGPDGDRVVGENEKDTVKDAREVRAGEMTEEKREEKEGLEGRKEKGEEEEGEEKKKKDAGEGDGEEMADTTDAVSIPGVGMESEEKEQKTKEGGVEDSERGRVDGEENEEKKENMEEEEEKGLGEGETTEEPVEKEQTEEKGDNDKAQDDNVMEENEDTNGPKQLGDTEEAGRDAQEQEEEVKPPGEDSLEAEPTQEELVQETEENLEETPEEMADNNVETEEDTTEASPTKEVRFFITEEGLTTPRGPDDAGEVLEENENEVKDANNDNHDLEKEEGAEYESDETKEVEQEEEGGGGRGGGGV